MRLLFPHCADFAAISEYELLKLVGAPVEYYLNALYIYNAKDSCENVSWYMV